MKSFTIKEYEFEFEFLLKGFDINGNHPIAKEKFKGPSLANCNKQFMKKNRARTEYILNVKCIEVFLTAKEKKLKK